MVTEFIQKLFFIWEKQMHLTRIKCEKNFVIHNFKHVLAKNEENLRDKLIGLRAIKNPKTEIKQEILELEKEIEELNYYKNVIVKGDNTEKELKAIIKETKKYLWKQSCR